MDPIKTTFSNSVSCISIVGKKGLLTVESSMYCHRGKRSAIKDQKLRKPFPQEVKVNDDDPDPSTNIKCRNAWQLKFFDCEYDDVVTVQKVGKKRKIEEIDDETSANSLVDDIKCERVYNMSVS